MRQNKSIELKAAFLLMVFGLNMVVAFACPLGLNMGYNEHHHSSGRERQVASAHSHTHAPGVRPHHHDTPASLGQNGNTKHSHDSKPLHSDSAATPQHSEKSSGSDDDCCTDTAIKFQTEDMKLQQSQNLDIKAPVFVAFLSAFLGFDLAPEKSTAATIFLVPYFYPPPDIRTTIQSFLI